MSNKADRLPYLEVRGYGRQYRRGRWAVRDLSFVVPDSGITALIGPNGAGKSTLLRACVGFEPADEGAILLRGARLDRRHRHSENDRRLGGPPFGLDRRSGGAGCVTLIP